MAKGQIEWPDIWASLRGANAEAIVKLAVALNNDAKYPGNFKDWVRTRSDKVQIEVLADAPIEILLGYREVIAPKALAKIAEKRSRPERIQLGFKEGGK